MEMTPERCDECGFDASAWAVRDAVTLFDALGWWWRGALDGVEVAALNTRPQPAVWSVLEYGLHSSLVTALHRVGIAAMLRDEPVGEYRAVDGDAPALTDLDPERTIGDLEREGTGLASVVRGTGMSPMATAALLHAVHDASHHQMDVGRGLAALGAGTPAGAGRVEQVSVSTGGVPKLAVGQAAVSRRGVDGDRQADRKHHGRPFQAVCLWSAEVIDELNGLGHSLAPGAAGENITVSGVDWATLRPGSRLRIGSVIAEVSFEATPCAKQTRWFSDGDFGLIDYSRNPRWTRWYAWVREPGEVATGDDVVVQPVGAY
jgi:MOSC domain-containing protein YiiM